MCYCCTLYTVSPTSIESIPYTSIYLPCTFLLLRWLSCSQTSGAVPADLAQSTARSLASDLLEGLSAQQRSCLSHLDPFSSCRGRDWHVPLSQCLLQLREGGDSTLTILDIQDIISKHLQTISIIQNFHGSDACGIHTLHCSSLFQMSE